jgi:DNA repair exonuclease SbcCD ATPase subunit
MILPKALALSVQIIMLVATVDRVPQLDVEPVCKGIAEQGGVTFRDPAVAQEKKNCIESEQAVREQVIKQWSSFSADDRTHCVNETTMGGLSSYTELLTCLEMARDVRAMRAAEAAAPSRAAATRAPSSPSTATVQPAPPAEPVSRPTSANEPQKLEVDSTLKELERAKAEAQNARSSEALAQRKLADAEAALQRTKEEAERTTNEAQRAKADAQAARESDAAAKRKLADAEAARAAAEGREQASQSAAKSQPGFGARLRKWFGR